MAMHATCCAVHESLCYLTPGVVTFHCDIHLDIPLLSDILTLQNQFQFLVDWQLLQHNASHIKHDYVIADLVLKKKHSFLLRQTSTNLFQTFSIL